MKKIILLLPLLLTACIGSTNLNNSEARWIQIGPYFAENKNPPEVFTSKDEITRPYGFVGVVQMDNVDTNRKSVLAAVEKLKKICSKHGADAVIISQMNLEDENSKGESISAHAIKYVDKLSDADQKAIDEYKVLGAVSE